MGFELLIKYCNNEISISRLFELLCLVPGDYYILSSEGTGRLELLSWLSRN